MSLEALSSAMRLSKSSRKDSKLTGSCKSLNRAWPEGAPSWGWGCSGDSGTTGRRPSARSMGDGCKAGTEGLDGIEDVVRET